MDNQHNNPDKSDDLSLNYNNGADLSSTIEFTEEEKNLLRRPNRQPLDGDYFEQSANQQTNPEGTALEGLDNNQSEHEFADSRFIDGQTFYNDELDEVEVEHQPAVEEEYNEFRYKPLKERMREERLREERLQAQNKETKPKKKVLGDLFNPSFEEKYDLNELEEITEYNQFMDEDEDSAEKKGIVDSVKQLFSPSSTESDGEDDSQDDIANEAFDEEVHQIDWLHQTEEPSDLFEETEDRLIEEEYTVDVSEFNKDQESDESNQFTEATYPMDEQATILSEGEVDDDSISWIEEEDAEEIEDENQASYPIDEEVNESEEVSLDDLSAVDKMFTDKHILDQEVEALSTKISQETATFEEPILTDQAINDYYGHEGIQLNQAAMEEDIDDEVESDKEGVTVGASWLTIGNILSRIIGALYVIPWATWLGKEYTQANVLYSIGYKPYSLILAVATAGFPSSIAKQMAFYHSKKEYKTADKLFKNSLTVMLITGLISAALLFGLAPLVAGASSTTNVVGATQVIRSLAPALLILPIMSLLRGYFQGFNDMKPTAISQILEQFARVGYLLAATYAVMMVLSGEVTSAVVHSTFAAFIGALLSLIYLIFEYYRRLPVIKKLQDTSDETVDLSFQESMKIMVVDSIPFILLGSGIIIAQLIDQFTFGQILSSTSALLFSEISEMYGALSLDVDKLVMIIISLAVSLASSLVPTISRLFARRDVEGTSALVEHILLLFAVVMVPASLGMASIANNIYFFFYPAGFEFGPQILITASLSSIILGAYTVLSTILQSMNYRRLAVRFLLVGIIVKAILQYPAVALFQAHGALISTAIAFLVSSILMWMKLSRELNFNHRQLINGSIKILVASILMTISAVMWNESLNLLFGPVGRGLTLVKIMIVVIMAVLTYGSILAITNMLPVLIGNRYKELQDKMRLM